MKHPLPSRADIRAWLATPVISITQNEVREESATDQPFNYHSRTLAHPVKFRVVGDFARLKEGRLRCPNLRSSEG